MRKLSLSCAAAAAISLLISCADVVTAQVQKNPSLELVSSQLEGKKRDKKLTGVVANKGAQPLHNVEVRFKLFAADRQMSDGTDSVDNLAPGATWNFRMNVSDKVTRYELVSLAEKPKDKDDDDDKD